MSIKKDTARHEQRLIRLSKVCDKTGLSRSGVYKRMGEGEFPKRVPLGGRAVAWVEAEIEDWVSEQIEQRGSLNEVGA